MKKIEKVKYIILFLVISFSYIMIRITRWNYNERWIENGMIALLALLAGFDGYLMIRKKLTKDGLLTSIIAAGCIMRIGYMLYTGCEIRSHDMYDISQNAYGQAAYILNFLKTNHLPQTNINQLYQQPFFYLMGAFVSQIINGILHCNEEYALVDATKIVSCFASCATIFLSKSICDIVSLKERGKILAVSIIAFLPGFYLSGGRVSCDALTVYFMTLAVMYTLLWMKEQTWKNTICLAVVYGLGVMTKISCGVIAIFTGICFCVILVKKIQMHQEKPLIAKYVVFAGISLPLGLWYSIRNYLKFGQSFTYVLSPNINSDLYCGNRSYVSRFLSLNLKNCLETPYAQPYGDYNFPVYLIKTALFGEFKYAVNDIFPILLLFLGGMIAVLLVGAYVWHIKQIAHISMEMKALISIAGLIVIFAVYFCVKLPFGCSMDYRYYGILGIIGPILLGNMLDLKQSRVLSAIAMRVAVSFGIISCIMYLLV